MPSRITLLVFILIGTLHSLACAAQAAPQPAPSSNPPPVWSGGIKPAFSQPFECVLASPKSWKMMGSAPEHYQVIRQLVVDLLSNDFCRFAWKLRSTGQAAASDFGVLAYSFPAKDFQGKRIRYSAILRTEDVTGGASLVGRVDDANRKVLAFDDMQTRAVVGTVPAKRYDVVLDVPESANAILIGFVIVGKGVLWMNEVHFETVGTDVPVTDTLNTIARSPEQDSAEARSADK